MATADLVSSLMGLGAPPPIPPGMPLQPNQNPLTVANSGTPNPVPAATPAPDLAANLVPGRQVQSLEELLFGGT